MQSEPRHVGIARTRTHVRRAVLQYVVQPQYGMLAVEHILPADAEVQESVEELASLEIEIVYYDFIGEGVVLVLVALSVLDDIFARFVHETRV